MPSVDIPSPSNAASSAGSAAKSGFGTGLPTPVLLGLVGGAIGLFVFLTRKSGDTESAEDEGTLLPNTAVMLGSLQQSLLELQGHVTMGNADLSDQLTGVGQSLGLQIDSQSGQTQENFNSLLSSLDLQFAALAGSDAALATTLAGLGTQLQDLSTNTSLSAEQQLSQYSHLTNQMQGIIDAQNWESTQAAQRFNLARYLADQFFGLQGYTQIIKPPTEYGMSWAAWNGAKFRTTDGVGVAVVGGKLYNLGNEGVYNTLNFQDRGQIKEFTSGQLLTAENYGGTFQ